MNASSARTWDDHLGELFSRLPAPRGGSLPTIVLRNRRELARARLSAALAEQGAPESSGSLRDDVADLIRRWAKRDFAPGYSAVEAFEVRCAAEQGAPEAPGSPDSSATTDAAWRRKVRDTYGSIELRGLQTSARVYQDLEIAYVPLFLSGSATLDFGPAGSLPFPDRRPAVKVLNENRRLYIVGGPGSGKSTLLAWLAVHAEAMPGAPLPFVVPVRSLAEAQLDADSIAAQTEAEPAWFGECLRSGRALVLIDGLDEAPGKPGDLLREAIARFADAHPEAHIVVSSRPAGVLGDDEPALPGFTTTRLMPMTAAEVEDFVDRWCLAAELSVHRADGAAREVARDAARRAAADLKARLRSSAAVRRLAETPLMCSVICIVHRFLGQRIPERRTALYEACTNVLLYEWDRAKFPEESAVGQLDAHAKRLLLGSLARQMHRNGLSEVPRDVVRRRFAERLPALGRKRSDADRILDEIRDRSGLLVERRPGVFAFSHLSFQEYLTALECVRRHEYPYLIGKHADRWWREVIQLAAGLPTADAARIVRGLLRSDGDEVGEGTLLAALCAETAIELPAPMRRAVQERVSRLLPVRTRDVAHALIAFGPGIGHLVVDGLASDDRDVVFWSAIVLSVVAYEPAFPRLAGLFDAGHRFTGYAASSLLFAAEHSELAATLLRDRLAQLGPLAEGVFAGWESSEIAPEVRLVAERIATEVRALIADQQGRPRSRRAGRTG